MIVSSGKRPTSIDELISPELAARLDRLDVLSRRVFAGKLQGERRSKRRGQSVEFADHRGYVAGDDLRRIDWNVFARLDRFFIKIFQEEEDLSLHLVLDASASMDAGAGDANKLLFAQRVAMALGYIGLVNNNRVTASVIGGEWGSGSGGGGETAGGGGVRRLEPMRGRRNVQRLGQFLLDAAAPVTTARSGADAAAAAGDFTAALRAIARARTGRGVMVILSDFLIPGGYQEGLRYVAGSGRGAGSAGGGGGGGGAGFDTYCLQVLSPGEIDPALEAERGADAGLVGDLRLTDAETGRAAEVTVTADLLKRYRVAVDRYTAELKAFCTARGMAYALVRTDTPVESLVLDALRRRGLLG